MAIPRLETCCFACSLRSGAKIIGWVNFICTILTSLVFLPIAFSMLLELEKDPEVPKDDKELIPVAMGVVVAMIFFRFCQAVSNILLLIGAYKNKAPYLLWWVYCSLFYASFNIFAGIITYLVPFDMNNIIELIFNTVLTLYFTLVVYSFYREIQNGTNLQAAQ